MNDFLVRLFGWRALTVQGDPLVGDRSRWLARYLRPGPGRVLDAGCGNGAFSFAAARRGNTAVGLTFADFEVEKDTRRAALLGLANRVAFQQFDLRELDKATGLGTFDQIIALEVIEHILDDRKLVVDLARLLKPGGRLLLSTPYKHYRRMPGERISETEDGGHVRWGYTHEELRALLTDAGLEVEHEDYLGGMISQKITIGMRMLERVHPRLAWASLLPFRPLVLLDSAVTKLTRYPWMTVGVVGRKPETRDTDRRGSMQGES